jgi:hypothetical protein
MMFIVLQSIYLECVECVWQVGLGDTCYEDATKNAVLQCSLFQNILNLPEHGGGGKEFGVG